YTRFPGVRLQPLIHLSVLNSAEKRMLFYLEIHCNARNLPAKVVDMSTVQSRSSTSNNKFKRDFGFAETVA
ncbi:MAG: hypothetical protein IJR44_05015, partial [Neisseriaceae bacterium]|nr:hypothetical protein [Neisseriaceae bacterium]